MAIFTWLQTIEGDYLNCPVYNYNTPHKTVASGVPGPEIRTAALSQIYLGQNKVQPIN